MTISASGVSLPQKTADAIVDYLMYSGEFSAGDRLPSENRLAEKYSVSRSTLRESVKILAARGVVEIRRGVGMFVAGIPDSREATLPDLRRMRMELGDLYEVRIIFEPPSAALACTRATDEEIGRIEQLALEVDRLYAAGEDAYDADIAFHTAVIKATHNEFLLTVSPLIEKAMGDRRFLTAEYDKKTAFAVDHRVITKFIRDRDATGARAAVIVHLRRIIGAVGANTDFSMV